MHSRTMRRRMRTINLETNEGPNNKNRIPSIVHHLCDLLNGFTISFLEKGDLSYSFFCHMWKTEDMPSLHTCCPLKFDRNGYLQIIFFILLETQLFFDFSSVSSSIIPLRDISFQEVRTMVSLVPTIYALFTVYQNQHHHHRLGDNSNSSSIIDSLSVKFPIRITLEKYDHLQTAVHVLRRYLPGVGEDVYLMWCNLSKNEPVHDSSSLSTTEKKKLINVRSAFMEASYCGPVSTYFAKQHHLLQLQRRYCGNNVNTALPWTNITNWKESIEELGFDTVSTMITARFQDSDASKRNNSDSKMEDSDATLQPLEKEGELVFITDYIALRLQIMHQTILARRNALLSYREKIAQEKQNKEAQRIAKLRARLYAYEEPLRAKYEATQRAQAERERQVHLQWQLLHKQQQLKQQETLFNTDNNCASVPVVDISAIEQTQGFPPPVTGTKRKTKKFGLNTERISSLLDDLEAQIAAVTSQYDTDNHQPQNDPYSAIDTSDSDDDRGDVPSFLADFSVLSQKSNNTAPYRRESASSQNKKEVLSHTYLTDNHEYEEHHDDTADLNTLSALESLIASVASQYTSSRKRRKIVSTPATDENNSNGQEFLDAIPKEGISNNKHMKPQRRKREPAVKAPKRTVRKEGKETADMDRQHVKNAELLNSTENDIDNLENNHRKEIIIPKNLETLLVELENLTAEIVESSDYKP